MTKVAIVYHSGFGHTKILAEAVARGAASVNGTHVDLIPVAEAEAKVETLNAADAIIFGSPTYMGNVSGPFKSWMDATGKLWYGQQWKDKIAAGFTNSGNPSGDKLNTLTTMWVFAMQHSMIWVSQGVMAGEQENGETLNRLSAWGGTMATSANAEATADNPSKADQATGVRLGARVATFAKKLKG